MTKLYQMDYRKISLLLCFFFFVIGCKKKNCEEVIDQVYVYPEEAAKGKSFEERIEMFKIPEQTLHCLSTKALLKSCLDHPLFVYIWSRSELQNGFDDVKRMCNGFDELFGRGDKFQELIYLYKHADFNRDWKSYTDLENGTYMDSIVRVELIIAQYEVLHELSSPEKTELFLLTLENQKKKVDLIKYWSPVGMQTTISLLARIMYLDNYQPLVEAYNNNEMVFLSVANILILDYDVVNEIMNLSEDYLKTLKSKQR